MTIDETKLAQGFDELAASTDLIGVRAAAETLRSSLPAPAPAPEPTPEPTSRSVTLDFSGDWKARWGVSHFGFEANTTVVDGVNLRAKTVAKQQMGFGFYALVPGVLPADEVRVRYPIWFPSDFPWRNSQGGGGGKLPGIAGKNTADRWAIPGGGKRYKGATLLNNGDKNVIAAEQDGFSVRLYHHSDMGCGLYCYLPQAARMGVRSSSSYFGWSTRVKNADGSLAKFKPGWNHVDIHARNNTPGQPDGLLEVTLNDSATRTLSDVIFRSAKYPNQRLTQLWPGFFFGGGSSDYPDRDAVIKIGATTVQAWG